MARYTVGYDGWAIVEAETENEAHQKVATILAKGVVPNDGAVGEWYITEIDETEEDDD